MSDARFVSTLIRQGNLGRGTDNQNSSEREAHARLMLRKEVLRPDAVAAVICVESSMTTSAILDNVGNALHSTFTDNPDQEYAKQEEIILAALKLDFAPNRHGSGAAAGQGVGSPPVPQVPDLPGRMSTARSSDDEEVLRRSEGNENCVTLNGRKRAREGENPRQTEGRAVGPADLPRNESQRIEPSLRAEDRDLPISAPPSKQTKKSTQHILEKLKSRGRAEGGRNQQDSREATAVDDENNDLLERRFTEELVLSSQYSLP